MAQHYSDPKRASSPHSLPDTEVFFVSAEDFVQAEYGTWMAERTMELEPQQHSNLTDCGPLEGWYYWYCLPGCLPDSDPCGPFATEEDALDDARENAGVYDDEGETD